MATPVRYNGDPSLPDGDSRATPPLVGPIKTRAVSRDLVTVDEAGVRTTSTVTHSVQVIGWEPGDTVLFDRALAERYGRTCGPACDGDCFADSFAAAANAPYSELQLEPQPFELLTPSTPTTPAPVQAPADPALDRDRAALAAAQDALERAEATLAADAAAHPTTDGVSAAQE